MYCIRTRVAKVLDKMMDYIRGNLSILNKISVCGRSPLHHIIRTSTGERHFEKRRSRCMGWNLHPTARHITTGGAAVCQEGNAGGVRARKILRVR